MPVYSITSPETGRSYQVNIDGQPDGEDIDSIWTQLDAHAAQREAEKPFFGVGDTLSGIGSAIGGLTETLPASYYRLTEGLKRPDQYSPEARAAFDAEQKFTQQVQQESQNRLMRGEATSAGNALREAAPSLGFSAVTMGASLLGKSVGRPLGAVVGGVISAPTGPGAVGGAGLGATIGDTVAGMAASGYTAYRMAGNQFLDQAFQRIGEQRAKEGKPWGEQEKLAAYNDLLPLAQNTGLWEAGPEAVGNALGLVAGKYVLGFGKKAAGELVDSIWKTTGKKVAAAAGGLASEVGTETITQLGAAPAQAQADALASGNPNWRNVPSPYAAPGGVMQAIADVAPATLAQSALMLGAGGVAKGTMAAANRMRGTVPDAVGGAGSTPAAGASVSPLPGIAQRGGTVDVPPLVPGLEAEDIGPLTAADVQDMETIGQGDNQMPRRQPILSGVPDRVAPFRDRPLNAEPQMSGDVITDLRIPRSPQAIAESQRIEQERQQQIAEMRMLDAKARGMPLIADSPTGSRDILDWANENPIYLPPGFSEERKLPEYEALGRNPLPNYWRQFVASGKQGGNPDTVAQRAFDAGLIAEPTADAYMQALQDGIAGRKQYRVQFQQREKDLAQEEKRVIDFEKSQSKLAKKPDTQQVPFEDVVPGDRMTIDGEPAVVKNVEYNEDGYLTNVVIEDGKRFGLMQFDPQNRGGILVDEYQPKPRPAVEDFAPADGVGQPMSDAPTSTTTTPAATAPAGAAAAMPGRGEGGSGGAGVAALLDVAPSTRPRNRGETTKPQREDVLAELGQATREGAANQAQGTLGFTNLDTSGRTAGFLNTEILAEAEALVRRGVRDFAAWSRAMIARFGEGIRTYLAGVWDNVRRNSQLGAVMNPFARGPLLAPASDMASTSGAAQNAEPSPGGLSEAEEFLYRLADFNLSQYEDEAKQLALKTVSEKAPKSWTQNQANKAVGYLVDLAMERKTSEPEYVRKWANKWIQYYGKHAGDFERFGVNKRESFFAANNAGFQRARTGSIYISFKGQDLARIGDHSPSEDRDTAQFHIFKRRINGNELSIEETVRQFVADRSRRVKNDEAAKVSQGGFQKQESSEASAFGGNVASINTANPPAAVNPESSRAAGGTGLQNLDTAGRTAGFLNTEILAEATALVRQGITDFTNWSQAMVTRFGNGIRDYLQGIWAQITSPQTNAAQNVRLGLPQGTAPVSVGSGGFVGTGQDVTRSRFANPEEGPNLYDVQSNEQMRGESTAWLDANGLDAALMALETNTPPSGLRIDHLPSLGSALIRRLTTLTEMGTEAQRLAAEGMLDRAGKAWHGAASQEAGRTLQQRAAANQELVTIAPVLAAKQVLVDRADRVMKERFTGGAEGATTKIKDTAKKADKAAGEELAADLDAETSPGDTANPRRGAVKKKHLDLAKALNALRKKIAPGMRWADIFMELPETQKERQREIYRRLMLDQRLKALTQEERLALTNELDRAWQRERRKVFLRELEKMTGLGKSKADTEKVKKATPRLLRLMNLGMLNSETFRAALAQEYGLRTLDAKEAAELRKLGEDVQRAPDGLPRRKLAQQLIERLQALTGSTKAEILESWWTSAVLSGWRTQVDIALGVANGLEDVTFGSLVTALRTGNGRVVKDAVMGMLSNLPTAMQEALDHVLTGNRSMMRNYDAEVKAALEDGNKLMGNVGRELIRKGGMARFPGAFMEFVSRLMTALDHINSTSTFQGAKAMALARHPDLYEQALRISPEDRAAARQQARLELTAGVAPTTRQQQLEETARMREILEARVPAEVIAQAREIGLEAALQGEPTGLGWFIYQVANKLNTTLRQATASYETEAANNAAGRTVLKALRTASTIVKVLTGTKFVRTVGHSVNRSLSYAPGLGLVRFAEGKMQGAKADILLAKQLIGTAVGLALLMAFRDGEDDEQGIEGNWSGLTPAQKGQLMAEGKQPYTLWTRDSTGRIRSWNYQQWGLSGVLATLGSMEDQRRYNSQGKDDLAILVNGIITGSMAWTDKAQLTGLQMLMGKDQTGTSSNPAASMGGQLNKWAATTVGGLIPRITKDIDMVVSPTLRDSSEWWMKWAAQVPMLRETASGKRLNIFGEEIQLDRTPLSRVTQTGTADPAYRTLGRLNERDIWLPDPSASVRVVKLADGTRRPMTPAEKDRFQKLTGAAYKALIQDHGQELLRMPPDAARDYVEKVTRNIRTRAAAQAVR